MSADEISALVEHQKKVQSPKKRNEQQDFQLFGIGLNVYACVCVDAMQSKQ